MDMPKEKPIWQRFLPIIILAAAFLIFILLVFVDRGPRKGVVEEQSWLVSVIKASPGDYAPNLILNGVIESPQRATLESTINADVKKVYTLEGENVAKDQLLIQLDDQEVALVLKQRQADVAELAASIKAELIRVQTDKESLVHEQTLYELALREYQRQEHLAKRKLGSEASRDQALAELNQRQLTVKNRQFQVDDHQNRLNQLKARYERAQALEAQAALDVKRTQIRAPFSGRITRLLVATGNRVQNGEALIELYDKNHVEVRAQIPSRYLSTIETSLLNKQPLQADGLLEEEPVALTLERVSGAVGEGRGGIDALFRAKESNTTLRLGRSMQILLWLPKKTNTYKIPYQALYGQDRVYLAKKGRMQSVNVERVGLVQSFSGSNHALIRSEKIQTGDDIVTTQLPNARSGLKIKTVVAE